MYLKKEIIVALLTVYLKYENNNMKLSLSKIRVIYFIGGNEHAKLSIKSRIFFM
jgi:hypothetical protein